MFNINLRFRREAFWSTVWVLGDFPGEHVEPFSLHSLWLVVWFVVMIVNQLVASSVVFTRLVILLFFSNQRKDLAGRSDLDDLSTPHQCEPVADVPDKVHVMGHDNKSLVHLITGMQD